jgi:hypothetical protein
VGLAIASKSRGWVPAAVNAKAAAREEVRPFQLRCPPRDREGLATISEESLIPMSGITRDAPAKGAKDRGYPAPPTM